MIVRNEKNWTGLVNLEKEEIRCWSKMQCLVTRDCGRTGWPLLLEVHAWIGRCYGFYLTWALGPSTCLKLHKMGLKQIESSIHSTYIQLGGWAPNLELWSMSSQLETPMIHPYPKDNGRTWYWCRAGRNCWASKRQAGGSHRSFNSNKSSSPFLRRGFTLTLEVLDKLNVQKFQLPSLHS